MVTPYFEVADHSKECISFKFTFGPEPIGEMLFVSINTHLLWALEDSYQGQPENGWYTGRAKAIPNEGETQYYVS